MEGFHVESVLIALGATSDEVVDAVVGRDELPDGVGVAVVMHELLVGGSGQHAGGTTGQTSHNMLVVAESFGEGLLEEGSPDANGLVNVLVDCVVLAISGVRHRHVVVDEDGVRDAHGVHVDTVDAIAALVIATVQEELLNLSFVLGQASDCGHKPAIADRSVHHIGGSHSLVSEEGGVGHDAGDSPPVHRGVLEIAGEFAVGLTHGGPVEGEWVAAELRVSPLSGATLVIVDLVEVFDVFFGSLSGCVAVRVVRGLSQHEFPVTVHVGAVVNVDRICHSQEGRDSELCSHKYNYK